VTGIDAEKAISELRKRVAEQPGQRVSAIMLREDGTYDVFQFARPEEVPQADGERQAAEEGGTP
jgi:hypothetical protein